MTDKPMEEEKVVLVTSEKALAEIADTHKLSGADVDMLKAAAGQGELVRLTPKLLGELQEALRKRTEEIKERHPKLVDQCPYETRLAVAAWVMQAICDHAREGGTFRYLIYDRLGFGPDAYLPLYHAGGMDISNNFDMQPKKDDE